MISIFRGGRLPALGSAGIAVALFVTGCGPSTGGANGASGSGNGASGLDHAKQQIAKYSQAIDGYVPTEKLSAPAALAGKKVMYIPAVAAIPFFSTSWKAVKEAFAAVGVQAEICDSQANPATTAACLDQARNEADAGVIMDAIPPALAQQSFDKLASAGIPVVLGNIPVPAHAPANVVSVGPDTTLAVRLAADAIIAKSGGKAKVVAVEDTDSPVTVAWYENGVKEFADHCPGCQVTTVRTKTADMQSLPSKVSAAILSHPGTDYLLPELSPIAQATIQGAADAGQATVPTASTATTFGDLQQVAAGKSLFTSVGWDVVRTSWYEADVLNRLILKQTVDATRYVSPVRVFDASNVTSLDISQNGWDDSNWFGGNAYEKTFRDLWK